MKRIVLPVMMVALAACSKPTAKNDPQREESSTPSVEAEKPADEPKAVGPKVAAATPEPKQYAPEGIYFLRGAARVETDAGIIGIKRGTQVTKIADGKYKTAAGDEIALDPAQLTNDLGEVRKILEQEHLNAAALANWKAQTSQAEQARQQAAAAVQSNPAPANPAVPAPAAAVAQDRGVRASLPPSSRMATPSSSLGVTHSAVKREDGWIWKKNAAGEWVRDHPVR